MALAVDVDGDDLTALRDRDDHGAGEQAHAGRGAMAHARLGGRQRRVGVEVVVGAQDLGEALVDHDGAVHLGELEEAVGGERDVEAEAVVAGREHGLGVADADEGAQAARDDHVEGVAKRRAGAVCLMAASLGGSVLSVLGFVHRRLPILPRFEADRLQV